MLDSGLIRLTHKKGRRGLAPARGIQGNYEEITGLVDFTIGIAGGPSVIAIAWFVMLTVSATGAWANAVTQEPKEATIRRSHWAVVP